MTQDTPSADPSAGQTFYRPDNYSADESIGLMMRRIITAVG
ncbi:MAG: MarR family transcriptional regulator, partial [Variovorax paradoxus]